MCNDEILEHTAVSAGRACGDLCVPLLYCPELLMKEFKSAVADMKNSVKDRGNAQVLCPPSGPSQVQMLGRMPNFMPASFPTTPL
jgi:hypothetical protein